MVRSGPDAEDRGHGARDEPRIAPALGLQKSPIEPSDETLRPGPEPFVVRTTKSNSTKGAGHRLVDEGPPDELARKVHGLSCYPPSRDRDQVPSRWAFPLRPWPVAHQLLELEVLLPCGSAAEADLALSKGRPCHVAIASGARR